MRPKLLMLLGIPFLVCVAQLALLLHARHLTHAGYEQAMAWTQHALISTSMEAAAAEYISAIGEHFALGTPDSGGRL